ncbi:hypothetical protein [Paenibacillus silvisoli]|uniref:hypothetical protein n=1 Tax=Paenibacillus silvisoli TaxID=3110539 RepID=UPI002805B85A|nr:hypothetical protein [Paenibacillus silvisoli]
MKKHKRLVKFVFGISIIGNVIFGLFLYQKNGNDQQTLEQVVFNGIQSNLVQLEGAITYQHDHGWSNPSHVTEKLSDVMEGIGLAFEIGKRSGALNKDKENLLWDLHRYLIGFKADSGYPNVTLSDDEREDYVELGENLRLSGWGMNLGYGSGWLDFEQKTRKLLG